LRGHAGETGTNTTRQGENQQKQEGEHELHQLKSTRFAFFFIPFFLSFLIMWCELILLMDLQDGKNKEKMKTMDFG